MIKRFFCALLCFTLLVVLASCGTQIQTSEIIITDDTESGEQVSSVDDTSSEIDIPSKQQTVSSKKEETSSKEADISSKVSNTLSKTVITENAEEEKKMVTTSFADNLDRLTLLGKYTLTTTGCVLNGSADSLSFRVSTDDKIVLNYSSIGVKSDSGHGVYFTVYIDGVRRSERYHINSNGIGTLTIAKNLGKGEYNVTVVRQTEYVSGTMIIFNSVSASGSLLASTGKRNHTIEFIGDSITAGYGSIADSVSAEGVYAGAPMFEDATKTYAYLTANNLGADIVVTAKSGIGLVKNSEGSFTMPEFYKYYPNLDERLEPEYDTVPDIVVISLGTNDKWQGVSVSEFTNKLVAFAKSVKAKYPEASIILMGGMMINDSTFNASYSAAAKQLGGKDAGYYSLVTSTTSSAHPISTEHITYANELVEFINSKNLLK